MMDNIIRNWWLSTSRLGLALLPVGDGKWFRQDLQSSTGKYVLVMPRFVPIGRLYLIPTEVYDETIAHIVRFKALAGQAKLVTAATGVAIAIYSSMPSAMAGIVWINLALILPIGFTALIGRNHFRRFRNNWTLITPIDAVKRKFRLVNIALSVVVVAFSFLKDITDAIPFTIQKGGLKGTVFTIKQFLETCVEAAPGAITRGFIGMFALRFVGKTVGSLILSIILGGGLAMLGHKITRAAYDHLFMPVLIGGFIISIALCLTTYVRLNPQRV